MPIQILAPEVVSKIAAGEVIERPASVVKELVENSLDADANQIHIEIQSGGLRSIKVIDNGTGIRSEHVELAFYRYATSKIVNLVDLEAISTLGFRGEALPSIAAVAEVEILTQTREETVGSYLRFKDGIPIQKEKQPRPPGTTVTVNYLFRNFPARLKFLKSQATENGRIAHLVTQYALAFPEVKFSLCLEGYQTLRTSGNGNLRDVIAEVYGHQVSQEMLEIRKGDSIPLISGLISPPSLNRSNRSYFSFFVNRRWVRSHLLSRAVEESYQGLLPIGKYPVVILNIFLSPRDLDINIHPTKSQVRFRYEQAILGAVVKAMKRTLAQAPSPKIKITPSPSFTGKSQVSLTSRTATTSLPLPALPFLRVLGQLANSYIIAEGPEGLYFIDQHAAHERVMFEKIKSQYSQRELEIQGLLQPVLIEPTPKQEEIIKSQKELLAQFGFVIEPFGKRTYLARTVPAVLIGQNFKEALTAILDSLSDEEPPSQWPEKIIPPLACHSAIRAGQTLTFEEMKELLRQLEETSLPGTCPHGRPTMIHLSSQQLEKEFSRTS